MFLKPRRDVPLTYVMFFDLTRQKTAENNASPEQFLRVAQEDVSWPVVLGLVQIKLFSIPIIDCLLIFFSTLLGAS